MSIDFERDRVATRNYARDLAAKHVAIGGGIVLAIILVLFGALFVWMAQQ